MVLEDHFDEEALEDLVHQIEDPDVVRIIDGVKFEYHPEDCRATPCSDGDIDALNRALDEKYFGGNY